MEFCAYFFSSSQLLSGLVFSFSCVISSIVNLPNFQINSEGVFLFMCTNICRNKNNTFERLLVSRCDIIKTEKFRLPKVHLLFQTFFSIFCVHISNVLVTGRHCQRRNEEKKNLNRMCSAFLVGLRKTEANECVR